MFTTQLLRSWNQTEYSHSNFLLHDNLCTMFTIYFSEYRVSHKWGFANGINVRWAADIPLFRISKISKLHTPATIDLSFYLFIYLFFYEIECKKGRTSKMQPQCISKDPCITEEKRKSIEWEGGGVGVWFTRVLKVWRL